MTTYIKGYMTRYTSFAQWTNSMRGFLGMAARYQKG